MKKYISILFAFLVCYEAQAQRKTENVIIITLDGFRWQEMFSGMDSLILRNEKYTEDEKGLSREFWSTDSETRRKKLLPFLWTRIATQGQIYGNRKFGNKVDVANKYKFSYPGYNEIFTGYPDTAVNSNDKIPNKNENVFEFLNKQKGFSSRVAVFGSWDVFPFIFNEERSGVYVNAGIEKLDGNSGQFQLLNEMQSITYQMLGVSVRPDLLTYFNAKEYLKQKQPRILYLALDETDDFAHAGKYDLYLKAAHMADKMIADLWNLVQSMPSYKDKTTFIITTDHGRGDKIKDQWRDHGENIGEATEMWIAVIGPDTKPVGEVKKDEQLYQGQLAATIAELLGFRFKPVHPLLPAISAAMR